MNGTQMRDRALVSPKPPALPIDPRIAARWVSVRRDQHRRRMRMLVVALVVVTVLVGAGLLTHSPLLAVSQVTVRGIGRTTRDQVVAAAGLRGHPAMLQLDLAGIRDRVEALPWVARATVQRRWPTTVSIAVIERVPAAQTDGPAGQPAVVDATGRVLAVGQDAVVVLRRPAPLAPLPLLHGVGPVAGPGSSLPATAHGTLQVLATLETRLGEHGPAPGGYIVSGVAQAVDGTLSATLSPGVINVIVGSIDQLDAKVVALRSVLARLAPGRIVTIDVRVADAPVLTDSQNSTRFSTTQRG